MLHQRIEGSIPSARLVVLAIVALTAAGCATPDYNYTPRFVDVSEPPVGKVHTAYVGDRMLRQAKYTEHEAIYLPTPVDVSWAYDLEAGYYLKKGEDEDTETFQPGGGQDSGGVVKAALADPWEAIMAYKGKKTLCVITVFSATSCTDNASFERRAKPILASDSFQQTLIYSGRVGEKVNVTYREFANNVARPAFSNNVEYDLGDSETIGYKGARLRVMEATNEYIRYEVIRNFNEADL